jgi:hypothetical protein
MEKEKDGETERRRNKKIDRQKGDEIERGTDRKM